MLFPCIEGVGVTGSRAIGNALPDSDIDLVVTFVEAVAPRGEARHQLLGLVIEAVGALTGWQCHVFDRARLLAALPSIPASNVLADMIQPL